MFLEMLEQRAAGAVNDALGHTGRAGRIQDVQRVIERKALEGEVGVVGAEPVGTKTSEVVSPNYRPKRPPRS